MYGINGTTLMIHAENYKCNRIGRPTVLTKEEEEVIINCLCKSADWDLDQTDFNYKCVQDYLNRINRENLFKKVYRGEIGYQRLKLAGKMY